MEIKDVANKFLTIYPEFKECLNDLSNFESVCVKVSCIYSEFSNLSTCKDLYPYLALCAHYFVMGGFSASVGIVSSQIGLIASSSVGDVSVSYQGSPYANKGDDFTYFLAQTKYGQEYLAWLARQSGLGYVN